MRNLEDIGRSFIHFRESPTPLTAACWDTSDDSLVCVFGPTEDDAVVELKRIKRDARSEADVRSIASWDAPCPNPELTHDRIIACKYFADTASVCVVFAGGDLVVVREAPLPGEDLLEIVGSVDQGITAAQWSPDEEILALATGADTFILMSRDFEPLADVTVAVEDAQLSKHVNVGWGKKETQFQGKRAKALRDPTMPEKVDEGLLGENDDKQVTISWRGDGQYVAMNCVDLAGRRMIRVYSRDGVLDSVSEPVDYLEGALSWRPAGNLIASVQRQTTHLDVVFFERNGLRHGEFDLRLSVDDMAKWGSTVRLLWNIDSTVLAAVFRDRVLLWTMGNYHYYLKQEIVFDEPSKVPIHFQWHPEKPLRLAILRDDQIRTYDFVLAVFRGTTCPPNDYGSVLVLDGDNLKLTPFRTANIPPPMCLHEEKLREVAVHAAFSPLGNRFAVLFRKSVAFYDYEQSLRTGKPKLLDISPIPDTPYPVTTVKLMFNGESQITISCHSSIENSEKQFRMEFPASSRVNSHPIALSRSQNTEDSPNSPDVSQANGTVNWNPRRVPQACQLSEGIVVAGQLINFGLASNGNLYADNRVLLTNCTSFLLTPAHLIVTTTQHLLKFVHLTSVNDLEIPPDEPETDERCRSVERGARLVTVIPSTYSLILQMPRGNLETIYPRALVLAGIREAISVRDYKSAFLACRNQRVDMNILHDHAPQQFMENVGIFIKQVRRVDFIDLFLSQLREEDVSQTMYRETLKSSQATTNINGEMRANGGVGLSSDLKASKVNRICDAFLAALEGKTSTNLQNIITAHVCKSPPDLEGGLSIVAELRRGGDDLAEQAAEHICFLADVNKLYDSALGMYDVDLALQIAQQSQKDPREYLPYLQGLQEMPLLSKCFTIDHDLGRRDKALSHSYALGDFEEFTKYTEKYSLYATALDLCKYNTQQTNDIMRLQASFFLNGNRYKEAGVSFEYLQDYVSALTAYRSSATHWREALFCATLIPSSPKELDTLARDLADALVEAKDYNSAATIHLDYLDELDASARLLCKASLFSDALRLGARHINNPSDRTKFLIDVIDPSFLESFSSTTDLLADFKTQLNAQIPRLRELRVKKAQDPLAFYGGDASAALAAAGGAEGIDIPDNISLAPTDATTSGGTFMTRYTGKTGMSTLATNTTRKTSKNRRREERKRARGKKGSVYEEEYLVNSIGRLIERVNTVGEEVSALVEGLMRRGMRGQAGAIEGAMGEVVQLCKDCVGEVFEAEAKATAREGVDVENGNGDVYRPKGGEAVYLDAMEGSGKMTAPTVKEFRKLGLLH